MKLWKNKEGNLAVAFALSTLPVIGAAGAAIDYSRAINVRSFVQAEADAAALSGAQLGIEGNPKRYMQYLKAATSERYGSGDWIKAIKVDSEWLSETDFTVTVSGKVPVTVLGGVPGFPKVVPISVRSTVRIAEPRFTYKPPTFTELDYEAGDYNRISVYCFDPEEADNPETHGRTQMTDITDNGGTTYDYEMPACGAGELMSYKLLNVREARTEPHLWDDPRATRFEYFTDTTLDEGEEVYDLGGKEILETVLCDSRQECKPESQGGIIPEGKDRDPVKAEGTCAPGKFMYYGWEDRPPGMPGPAADWTDIAWTDSDYDDIRIVIECPELDSVEDRVVRLID